MRRLMSLALAALFAGSACTAQPAPRHLISGGVYLDGRGPDGNTVILDAPDGLIVVDSGRHPAHANSILAYAKSTGRPVAAIVNSHWHLDHTTGNLDLTAAFPDAAIIASHAIEGRLYRDYVNPGRERAKKALADGTAPPERRAAMTRAQRFFDHPEAAIPTRPVERSGMRTVAGRRLDVRLAPFAATEGDVWLVVPDERLVIVGDLVVDIVPFMDTACVDGWSKALEEIAAVDFDTLVPGHGAPMTKPRFLAWKSAFDRFADCGRSAAPVATCVDGWMNNAAPFIATSHQAYAREAAQYYVESRMRSPIEERQRYCAVPKD